jgi:hypothetical protein
MDVAMAFRMGLAFMSGSIQPLCPFVLSLDGFMRGFPFPPVAPIFHQMGKIHHWHAVW